MKNPNQKEYYKNKIVEILNESKKTITIDTDFIMSIKDACELGTLINEMTIKKIKDCDDHINYIKSN